MASIKDADRKLLWGRSGDECAFPACTQTLTLVPATVGSESASAAPIVVGHEAHIVAEEDNGPRGDPSMPISERNAYPNLMLLCPTHHTLIDKDHGIHFSVEQLHQMKAAHEALVERRRTGADDERETIARRRQNLLLEAASASRGRLITGWAAAGVRSELSHSLADDDSVGAPSRLGRPVPQTGLVVLEGDFGSGKSVTSERIHAADITAAIKDEQAPVPLYLAAKSVAGSLQDAVRAAAEGLGDLQRVGLHLILDGLDEPGPARASELLNAARTLVLTWRNSRVVATARPGLALNPDEKLAYPPLSDDEAIAVAERLDGDRRALWSDSEAIHAMLHLPLFLIVAVLRQQAGAEVPRSRGTFLEALATAALEHSHLPTEQARQALQSLARMTVASGGAAAAAELGSDEAVRAVLETRLVVRTGRSLRFALPVVEQYFAARSVLEGGLDGLDLDNLQLLDRWRDSLMLAITVGSWRQVSALLDRLAPSHPGLASWLVVSAVPASTMVSSADVPDHLECARRVRHALSGWVGALGQVGQLLHITDSSGSVRTVATFVEGNRVAVALRNGDNAGTDTTRIPPGINPFTGKAPDGSEWGLYRHGNAPADFMAWPWQWGLDWVSAGIEPLFRAKVLGLPDTKPFQDERRWQLANAIMRRRGHAHAPLDQAELRHATERLLSCMTEDGSLLFQQNPLRGPTFSKDEIAALIRELDEGSVLADDGQLHRPYPAPDAVPSNNHIGSAYSDESLRGLVEQVYTNALLIYQDLVITWFPTFAPLLGLACIMPVIFTGRVMPRGDLFGGPDFVSHMEPLPPTEPSRAEIYLAATREEFFGHEGYDVKSMMKTSIRIRRLIAAFHPGAEGWADPRSANADLSVWGNRPATAQAYQWLWEDLQKLHMVKNFTRISDD